MGIDEALARTDQVYLRVVYHSERRVLPWVSAGRTEEAVRPFFAKEMGAWRCLTLQTVWMDV
jgi:hypothetical protein